MIGGALVLMALAGQASQPASQPLRPGGSGADVYGELTQIFEVGENSLNAQESWRLRNQSGKSIPAAALTIDLPKGTRRVRLDEGAEPFFAPQDNKTISANGPLGAGDHSVSAAYQIKTDGGSLVIRRKLPFRMGGARVILENIAGLQVSSNVNAKRRVRELNGLEFAIWDVDPMPAGSTWEIRIQGLPTRSTWPRNAALAACVAILGWMIFALINSEPNPESKARPGALSPAARRDRIVKAIELLDADLDSNRIEEPQYKRRNKALLKELAEVLRELDVEKKSRA